MVTSSESRPSPLQRLRQVLTPERSDVWTILLYVAAVGVLTLIVPVTTQALVNTAAFGTLLQPLLILAALVFAVLGAAGFLRVLQVIVAERLQQRIFARMAVDLAHRLPRVRIEAFDQSRGTELVNRFFDVLTIQKSTALILLDGLAVVLQTAIGMVLLALYHPFLLGFDVLLLGSMGIVLFGLGRGAVRTSVAESYAKYGVVAWLEELARAPLAFRLAGGPKLALRHADAATVTYLGARQKHFRILLRQIVGTLVVQAVGSAALLGLGGWLVSRQQLTLGQLVAAELIVTPSVASFAKFGKYLETFYELLAGVDKVGHLFELPLEHEHGETLADGGRGCQLELRGVTFARGSRLILDQVELELAPGDRLAVLGGTAAGKSALADVMTGNRHPQQGLVRIDGLDLREVAPPSLRARAALVRSHALFDGTLRDNLRMDREGVEPHHVAELLDRLGLRSELESLPQGLDAVTTGADGSVSTGEAALLTLGRAVLGRPGLLVVDEVLDGLEDDACTRALDLLLDPTAPWTLVVLTRSPTLASRLPRAVRLQDGKLVEGHP